MNKNALNDNKTLHNKQKRYLKAKLLMVLFFVFMNVKRSAN